jgi:hypothetical protein
LEEDNFIMANSSEAPYPKLLIIPVDEWGGRWNMRFGTQELWITLFDRKIPTIFILAIYWASYFISLFLL